MGQPKGTAADAPDFGMDRDRKNPDMSIVDIYAEDGEVWVQVGGMHEPYSIETAEEIRNHLSEAIQQAKND